MSNVPKHHYQRWTAAELERLDKLIAEDTPTRVMGLKLGRTSAAVYNKASERNRSVKPTNRSPYNRRKTKK